MSAGLARGDSLRGSTPQKAVPFSGRNTPISFIRRPPRPAPGPPFGPFVALGKSRPRTRGGTAQHNPLRFQPCLPDWTGGEWKGVGLKTSLKTSSWFPQFRGLPLILVTEDWASLSSTHRGAKEGRNQHPRHTEFSPPRPSRLERRPKAQACLDRVRPRGCGGVGLRGGARRCARLAEVGPCCPNCCPAQKS